jgi:hypothetical protein
VGASGVRLGDDGGLRVVRSAPPEDPDHLRRVAARLRAAAGPGVVPVLSVRDDGDDVEVVLAYAGRALAGPLPARDLAPIVAAVASHLADLQLRGIAHGALRAEHVLVDASGAVRLCGLDDGDAAGDVVALGQLVDDVLDPDDQSREAGALRATASRCATDDAAARPTMAALSASLATAVPARRAAIERQPRPTPRRRPLALVGIAVATVVGGVALSSVVRAAPDREEPTVASTTSSTTTTTATTTTTVATPRTVEHDGATWTFGTTADQLLLGRWRCDVATPALLEADGDVYVIDEWPADGELAARFVMTIADAERATVDPEGGCDRLLVRTTSGKIIEPALAA